MCACMILLKKSTAMPQNYDIFLSFRGVDTRKRFTDFLYISLVDAGFHVFRDNNALAFGEEIDPELLRAIRNCRIAIPIISKQYAQSKSCLCELTEIMDCRAKQRTSVFPVFFKVDVVDVLEHRRTFGEALQKHEEHCNSKDVQNWKSALTSVAKIKGWTSRTIANGNEGELVEMVVAKVSSALKMPLMEQVPFLPILMSYYRIRSAYLSITEGRSEVFLAFHGPDTGCGFAAYLYSKLVQKGIGVFNFDDPSLIGKDVSDEIQNAIDNCHISIPILSENFASSSWCLDQLAQMVKCKKAKKQKMLPIFYKVKPSGVKDLLHSFGDQKKASSSRRYKRWKEALREVGSAAGLESDKIADGHEGKLAKQVVEEVLCLLKNPQTQERCIRSH